MDSHLRLKAGSLAATILLASCGGAGVTSSSSDGTNSSVSSSGGETQANCIVGSGGATLVQAPGANDEPHDNNTAPLVEMNVEIHGQSIYVDASSSIDPDGDNLDYRIEFGDGLSVPHHNAWHTYHFSGDYTVTVIATDGLVEIQATRDISVTPLPSTANQAPIAYPTFAEIIKDDDRGVAGEANTFSSDPDGDDLSYTWLASSEGCGQQKVNGGEISYFGVYPPSFVLTVNDGQLGDTRAMNVYLPGSSYWDASPQLGVIHRRDGLTVHVDARLTDGGQNFEWNFADEAVSTNVVDSHTFSSPGTYEISLYSDRTIFSSMETIQVRVGEGNTAPHPIFSCQLRATGTKGFFCTFPETPDPEGDYLRLKIDFGDGTTEDNFYSQVDPRAEQGSRFEHEYAEPGIYTIEVSAYDGELTGSYSLKWDSEKGEVVSE